MRRYGLDQQQAEVALVAQQGGLCDICGRLRRLIVDHDHRTGAARGMLCSPCNVRLEGTIDHPERWLRKAEAYATR